MVKGYWRNGQRPWNCGCGKTRYRTEDEALAAAARDKEAFGGVITVYRCSGAAPWHVTSKGFQPSSLGSAGRRLAYELLMHDVVRLDDFRRDILRIDSEANSKQWRRVRRYLAQLVELGAATEVRDEDGKGTGRISPLDRDALKRIVQIGFESH